MPDPASDLLAEANAHLDRITQREWIACLTSVVTMVAQAGRHSPGEPVFFRYRFSPVWEARCEGELLGYVDHPDHLESVLAHCAASGWTVERLPLRWWHRLLGRPPAWRVEVP